MGVTRSLTRMLNPRRGYDRMPLRSWLLLWKVKNILLAFVSWRNWWATAKALAAPFIGSAPVAWAFLTHIDYSERMVDVPLGFKIYIVALCIAATAVVGFYAYFWQLRKEHRHERVLATCLGLCAGAIITIALGLLAALPSR